MKTYQNRIMKSPTIRLVASITAVVLVIGSFSSLILSARAGSSPSLAISQIPLTVSTPAHPQVLIALGNSESMDGTLSGAIMTGSGTLGSGLSSLSTSSSPTNYLVPSGFTPPVQTADATGNAPYSVLKNSVIYDNGASRLNVAKAGIQAIIQSYVQNTDFALETYQTSGTSLYSTWVYHMSPLGSGFNFTSTQVSGKRYISNPCLGYSTASTTVKSNCTSIAGSGLYTPSTVATSLYMEIGATSDDPNINDVLYAPSQPGVFLNWGGPSPVTPYPPYKSLSDYNNGNIFVNYTNSAPSANTGTGPTNAGYVPYSTQVMYSARGFGYGGSQSATTGNVLVPMTSAGVTPTTATIATAVGAFTPNLAPETNSLSTKEIKSVAGQAPTAGLLTTAKSYLASVAAPASGCPPAQYVILISDGLPTQDLAGKAWPPLGSAAAIGYGVSATFSATDGSLSTTNDQALTDTVNALKALKSAGIQTYIIGLGAGVDPSSNPQAAATLKAMAVAGGTVNYYPASSPTALVNDLNSILISVQSGTLSTTSAAVNSTYLQAGSVEYQANFTSGDTPYQDWTGDLFEKNLDPITGAPTGNAIWSARSQLDLQAAGSGWLSGRNIATWNPALNNNSGGAIPFQWLSLGTSQQTALQPSDALGATRLQYLRGNSTLEQHNSGGVFRNRSHILGDIVNSQPLYIAGPNDVYFTPSYRAFAATNSSRMPMLYVGGNDGMLHGFNAATGVEQFAFIPNAVYANLKGLTDPLYNQNHRYFVDGSPQSGDVKFADGTWHTLLVGGEGGGGNSIYAMDVTSPQTLTTEASVVKAVLWEFSDITATGASTGDMGYTYSEPQIAPINASAGSGFAVFFGNGYNSPNNSSVLYAINPQNGQIIKKIDLCAAIPTACNSSLPQGLSTVAVGSTDSLLGQPITQIYAGDLQGNLWAIDVGSSTVGNWTVRLLFQAKDKSGNVQPITTRPVVTLHPNYPKLFGEFIMIGTGQLLTTNDLSSSQIQSVYGIWDKPNTSTVPTRSNLQAQTLNLIAAGAASGLPQDVITATSVAVDWSTQRGWYVDLFTGGQKVVTTPQLLNGALLLSLNTPPASNTCNAGFTSAFMELNYATGGAFSTPQLDINGDLSIDSKDTVNKLNPVGIGTGTGYLSQPTTIYNKKKKEVEKLATKSGGTQLIIKDKDNSQARASWWEIKQ
ncbi:MULTISPECIES: PilC/PilY family type IV pilus protein [unclassified Undibacterium]|uniref:pilus assembly protein n=1 Tax=unclassified Undibacterium TaxID=2630295 RepID=UPI003393E45E